MKKVKLMLLSLSIFAVVGGALAFTVRTGGHLCTAAYNNGCPATCPNFRQLKATGVGVFMCTADTVSGGNDECHNGSGNAPACGGSSVQETLE